MAGRVRKMPHLPGVGTAQGAGWTGAAVRSRESSER